MNFRKRIAIDLGTTSVQVFTRSKGVIVNEPSVVAVDRFSNKVLAVGTEAKNMLGRTPGHIVAVRPLIDGVINDYEATERMLRYFIKKSGNKSLIRPDLIICVSTGSTQVQKRAVKQAGIKAGANEVHLIEEPLAAAIGAGVNMEDARGTIIVNIGGGITDIAVISKGGIVVAESLRVAGDACDKAIVDYVRKNMNTIIGEKTAEEIKHSVGTILSKEDGYRAKGRNLKNGLPSEIMFTSKDFELALENIKNEISSAVQRVLSVTPPELVADIFEDGAIMTGGGSLIRGLRDRIEENTKLNVEIAEDPIQAVIRGTGKSLNWMNRLEKIENSKLELTRRIVENNEKLRRR